MYLHIALTYTEPGYLPHPYYSPFGSDQMNKTTDNLSLWFDNEIGYKGEEPRRRFVLTKYTCSP